MKDIIKSLNNYVEHEREDSEIKISSNFVLHLVDNSVKGFGGIKTARASLIYLIGKNRIELFIVEKSYSVSSEEKNTWEEIKLQFTEKVFNLFKYDLMNEIVNGTYGIE